MRVSINCPSYKRPKVETLNYLPSCQVWVAEREYDNYVKANPSCEKNIIAVPNEVQGNVSRIRNYIIDKEFEVADVVLLIDDDLHYVARYEPQGLYGYKDIRLTEDELYEMLVKYSVMCKDMGFYHWGINCNKDCMSYKQTIPFNTKAYVGSPFSVFLKGNECRYDERFPLKEDYDMTLQQCNKYRGLLRVNKYHYDCKQSKQAGGCATYRNREREIQQVIELQKKWGKDIVKFDTSRNPRAKKETLEDYNPIIRVPIGGV